MPFLDVDVVTGLRWQVARGPAVAKQEQFGDGTGASTILREAVLLQCSARRKLAHLFPTAHCVEVHEACGRVSIAKQAQRGRDHLALPVVVADGAYRAAHQVGRHKGPGNLKRRRSMAERPDENTDRGYARVL